MKYWLSNYSKQDDAKLLLDGFSYGFHLQYSGPRIPMFSKNLKSAILNTSVLDKKLKDSADLGRILGPFKRVPISNLRVNPVGLVPKQTGGWRLITHLSYPPGLSVNDYIDPAICAVHYSKFDNAIEMVQKLGPSALMAKKDIKSAFDLCPVNPSDFCLLGIHSSSGYWIQKTLPQGAALSPAVFEVFSTFVQWAVINSSQSHLTSVDHYLDDFWFAGRKDSSDCLELMDTFDFVCKDIGIPINHDKTEGPTTRLTYLGIEIDSERGELKIPAEKILKISQLLEQVLNHKKLRLKKLQSIVGLLNFICKAIPSGRAFNRRFYDAMAFVKQPHHFVRLTAGMREDFKTWLMFLQNFNGISIFSDHNWSHNAILEFFTDAAGNRDLGCGAYFQGNWTFLKWPVFWDDNVFLDITYLELVPIILAFCTWGQKLKGKSIVLRSDNLALVEILNKKDSKNKRVMSLIRYLVLYLLQNNIQVKSVHIKGEINSISDAISRLQWDRLNFLLPETASKFPTPIPEDFLRLFNLKSAD